MCNGFGSGDRTTPGIGGASALRRQMRYKNP